MDTVTGNKIIAEFMGVNYYIDNPLMKVCLDKEKDATLFYCEWHPDLKLDGCNIVAWYFEPEKNWCQLMPVVEKIEALNDKVVEKVYLSINGKSCGIWTYFDIDSILRNHNDADNGKFKVSNTDKTKILATWRSVTQFIQWHNENAGNNLK